MHAVALWAAVAALAAGIGPPLGGLLITASSWRLVFLVNIPVGVIAFLLARRVLVESRAPGRRRVPDLLGGVVFALAIASLVLAVVKGQEWGWSSARVLGSFAAAVVLGAYFVVRSSRQRTPVIDLSLLRIRAFALSNGVTVVMASGFYAYTLCNVLFLTSVWRYSILEAGLALTPGPFVAMAVAGPASRAVERLGHRAVARAGRADVGRRHGLLRVAARRLTGLPRRVAAGDGDPRYRRGAHVPDAERRRRRLGARAAIRHSNLAELGRSSARRRARSGDPDRDHRQTHAPSRRCTHSSTDGCLPEAASWPARWRASRSSSRAQPAMVWTRSTTASPLPHRARSSLSRRPDVPQLPSLAESEGEQAVVTAADSCGVPAQRPGVRRALGADARADRRAGERRQPAPRESGCSERAIQRTGCTWCGSAILR